MELVITGSTSELLQMLACFCFSSCSRSASSIEKEALLMLQGGNPNMIRILGLYKGRVGEGRGLLMEFMPKGSVADLLQTLAGPPPWPLTFRMAHEISLGMNFLHHLTPPLLHLDLKPSNVLLDDSLRAKLTDFGLSRVARSVSRCSGQKAEDEGGTLSYMPPEALQSVNYKANKASDVYSVLQLLSGSRPHRCLTRVCPADAGSSLVRFRIPQGDRPDLTCIDRRQTEGLDDMVKLMTECWHQDPDSRPSFLCCVNETEKIFSMHKHGLNEAVYGVLKLLVQLIFLLYSPFPSNDGTKIGCEWRKCLNISKRQFARKRKFTEPLFVSSVNPIFSHTQDNDDDDDVCSGLRSIQISHKPLNGIKS
uniref:Receptor-interacting serine-threonine kinase 3 n=1 Tax=Sinocyclocheilus grahami TaxID=75366 RepID=A0A672M0B2_SINGR